MIKSDEPRRGGAFAESLGNEGFCSLVAMPAEADFQSPQASLPFAQGGRHIVMLKLTQITVLLGQNHRCSTHQPLLCGVAVERALLRPRNRVTRHKSTSALEGEIRQQPALHSVLYFRRLNTINRRWRETACDDRMRSQLPYCRALGPYPTFGFHLDCLNGKSRRRTLSALRCTATWTSWKWAALRSFWLAIWRAL